MTASAIRPNHPLTPNPAAKNSPRLRVSPIPTPRSDSVTRSRSAPSADLDSSADIVRPPILSTIRPVWTADCSATVELARLAGPRIGMWKLPRRLAHSRCAAMPCDLGRTDCQSALYQRCLIIGSQYDLYAWLNLPDLIQLWDCLVLPPGLRTEWTGAFQAAGLLPRDGRTAGRPDSIAIVEQLTIRQLSATDREVLRS